MRREFCLVALFVIGVSSFARSASADVFGNGADSFEIKFVTIGQPGNPPDENPNPAGAVPYEGKKRGRKGDAAAQ